MRSMQGPDCGKTDRFLLVWEHGEIQTSSEIGPELNEEFNAGILEIVDTTTNRFYTGFNTWAKVKRYTG